MQPTNDAEGDLTSRTFGADHDWLDTLVDGVLRAWAEGDADLATRFFTKLEHRLLRHMRVEDEELYAAMEKQAPPAAAALAALRAEHVGLRVRLDRIAMRMAESSPEVGAELRDLRVVLLDHERREEGLLFPLCDCLMAREARITAATDLDRRLFGPARLCIGRHGGA